MKFVFGYAGIPGKVYDDIYRERSQFCAVGTEWLSEPLRTYGNYTQSHANFFACHFCRLLRDDHHNRLEDTGFALIYIDYLRATTATFVDAFFPSVLLVPIHWALNDMREMNVKRAKNQLLGQLRIATQAARTAIPMLKKEITERANTTPLLLPVRNFRSVHLRNAISRLQTRACTKAGARTAIEEVVEDFQVKHPRVRLQDRRACYMDDAEVEFHSPGHARHAFARGHQGHPPLCLLSGRRRLGAPYDRAFHYDCLRGSGKLQGDFFGCHEEPTAFVGNPHLNIAPNDFVRA